MNGGGGRGEEEVHTKEVVITRYLIVSYREPHDVVSMGHVVDGSEGSFSILDTEYRDDAVEFLAKIWSGEADEKEREEYGDREIYAFVNGDKECVAAEFLCKDASRLSRALTAQRQKEKSEAKAVEDAAKVDAQRKRDLRELDRLSKKLGVETNAPKGG